ncbi:hypothetical protein PMAYCL1PPCAC_20103, partial [Pristionchus mayeri]
ARSRSRDQRKKGRSLLGKCMGETKSRRRHRRRRDDDDEEEGGFGGWKLGLVIGVIVVCFAIVYPHVFHPLLMSFLGRSEPPPQAQGHPPMHPGMAGRQPTGSRPGGGSGPMHPHMNIPAAATAEASRGERSGAKSMYTYMIPIYTVGVIAFLLYTMFKKKKKNRRNRRSRYSDDEYSDEEEEDERKGGGGGRGGKKMRHLQERLRQTESAMSKILEQLEKAQLEGKLTPEMMANLGAESKKVEEAQKPSSSKSKKTVKKVAGKADKTLENVAQQLPDEQTTQCMEDLEKALADFKELSDLYDAAQGGRRRRQASESEDSEEETGSEDLSDEDLDIEELEELEEERKNKELYELIVSASSSHPFPEEKDDEKENLEEEKEDLGLDSEEDSEEEDEEPEREPTPPPRTDEKVRRRKPQKI